MFIPKRILFQNGTLEYEIRKLNHAYFDGNQQSGNN